jgi:hypothetical protein
LYKIFLILTFTLFFVFIHHVMRLLFSQTVPDNPRVSFPMLNGRD